MVWNISQADVYRLDKNDLFVLIKECNVDPLTSFLANDLRKIGSFLKRFGKIIHSDAELLTIVKKLIDDPTLTLDPRETSVCPDLQLYSLLLQGKFTEFFERIGETTEPTTGAKVTRIRSPSQPPPPPPLHQPASPRGDFVDAGVAINALAEEMKRITRIIDELRADRESERTASQMQRKPTITPEDEATTYVGLDEAIRDIQESLRTDTEQMRQGLSQINKGIDRITVNKRNQKIGHHNYAKHRDSVELNQGNNFSSHITGKPTFELVSAIPSFSGQDDQVVLDFISQVDDVGNLSNWNDTEKLTVAKLKLTGIALSFSKSDECCQSAKTLSELQEALESRFRDNLPDYYYLEQLASVRQERGETIEKYADRVKLIGSKTTRHTQNPEVDQALKIEADRRTMEAFTRGLFGELGHEVRTKFPKTFKEAVTLAITIRNVERRPGEEGRFRNNRNVFFIPNKKQIQCKNCQKFGHTAQECKSHYYKNRSNPTNFLKVQSSVNPRQNANTNNYNNQNHAQTHGKNSSVESQYYTSYPNKSCTYCKRTGHLEVDCRTKARQQGLHAPQCQLCRKQGHTAPFCRFVQMNQPTSQGNQFVIRPQTLNSAGGLTTANGSPSNPSNSQG